jgi:pimeloyl-ACP methyl ester carboxylesterase
MVTSFTPRHRGGSGPPLVLVHGFTDTWRTWELVLPALERRHDVLAPTLLGHAGGPAARPEVTADDVVSALEAAMDAAGFETAHVAGNSLGGYLALRLAAAGRARSVVALAPAGGWDAGDDAFQGVLAHFTDMQRTLAPLAPRADELMADPANRRLATRDIATRFEHIPPELLAHMIRGVVGCTGMEPLIASALRDGWPLDAERVTCPVRMVWGTADRVLTWPSAAARYRRELPQADWVELDDAGHCPQLDVPLETAQLILGFTAG